MRKLPQYKQQNLPHATNLSISLRNRSHNYTLPFLTSFVFSSVLLRVIAVFSPWIKRSERFIQGENPNQSFVNIKANSNNVRRKSEEPGDRKYQDEKCLF